VQSTNGGHDEQQDMRRRIERNALLRDVKDFFIFLMQHARVSSTKPARRTEAKRISTNPEPPTKPYRKQPRSPGRFEEKRRGRAEGPITCAALRGVSGRRAAGVVGDGAGACACACAGREAGARPGFGGCLAGGLAGCAIGFLDRHGERVVGRERVLPFSCTTSGWSGGCA
jgi:hypothetical protein